ncbi:hypothetical protein HK100_008983 [Physocladia obscura]|uniref:Uncharacterized protein n=1 Tax=Physocladia obscura TaxID=109957 RepID=A0AAD5T9X8_9FUNG|nr:hypothetical protein HK100_008983 [Physocladia obscura]
MSETALSPKQDPLPQLLIEEKSDLANHSIQTESAAVSDFGTADLPVTAPTTSTTPRIPASSALPTFQNTASTNSTTNDYDDDEECLIDTVRRIHRRSISTDALIIPAMVRAIEKPALFQQDSSQNLPLPKTSASTASLSKRVSFADIFEFSPTNESFSPQLLTPVSITAITAVTPTETVTTTAITTTIAAIEKKQKSVLKKKKSDEDNLDNIPIFVLKALLSHETIVAKNAAAPAGLAVPAINILPATPLKSMFSPTILATSKSVPNLHNNKIKSLRPSNQQLDQLNYDYYYHDTNLQQRPVSYLTEQDRQNLLEHSGMKPRNSGSNKIKSPSQSNLDGQSMQASLSAQQKQQILFQPQQEQQQQQEKQRQRKQTQEKQRPSDNDEQEKQKSPPVAMVPVQTKKSRSWRIKHDAFVKSTSLPNLLTATSKISDPVRPPGSVSNNSKSSLFKIFKHK